MVSENDKGLPMQVEVVERLGGNTLAYGTVGDDPNFCAMLPGDVVIKVGELIKLEANPASLHVFDSKAAMLRREVPKNLF